MESARLASSPPKVASPALAGTLKDETKQSSPIEHSSDIKVANVKEADAASEGRAVNAIVRSLEKKTVKNTDQSELTLESMSTKDPISLESAPVPEEGPEKSLGAEQGVFVVRLSALLANYAAVV
ncbi:uncharacterized protein A4U43_C03F32230 [Asparagus officinalis]|uniref:Uncharacterized protein n=1 Tax=Asparagus officinalis TaxID=4686 RepID=A0A5P1FEK9_ASPOF|nr:uncharacterized protein A4U43_C03F32230 [Asparagus officinalis]